MFVIVKVGHVMGCVEREIKENGYTECLNTGEEIKEIRVDVLEDILKKAFQAVSDEE